MNYETALALLLGKRRGGSGSSGGEADNWVPFCADGTTWTGEEIHLVAGGDVISYAGEIVVSPHDQYRITFQGVEYICTSEYCEPDYGGYGGISNVISPVDLLKNADGGYEINGNPLILDFDCTTSFKVESWMGEEPYDMTFETLKNIVEVPLTSVYKPGEILAIPQGVTAIGECAFAASIKANAAWIGVLKLPASVKTIHSSAFYGQSYLKKIEFSEGLESIGNQAFYECTYLKSLTLPSTITGISSNAFPSSVTEINVPWAEGEVANAPWGASKATINYGHTGE